MSNLPSEGIRLNKFVAQSGLCSRRDAAHRIKGGLIKVNGEVVKDPTTLVQATDKVTFGSKVLKIKAQYLYILVNKPKNTLSTAKPNTNQKTIARVFGGKVDKMVQPVEPLRKDDTGLLLLTDDSELLDKLSGTDPKSEVVYHVTLDRPLSEQDRNDMIPTSPDPKDQLISAILPMPKMGDNDIQIDVGLGQYEAAREAFENKGYQVQRMDRLYFLGLTKKDLSRDRFRHLTPKEVIMIKHFS